MIDTDDLLIQKVSNYVRAPAAYREAILRYLRIGAYMQLDRMKLVKFLATRREGEPEKSSETVSILGRDYQIVTETEYGRVRFVRFRPSDRVWAAYWVRGNGMKIYGDYEAFERDIVLLKTAN